MYVYAHCVASLVRRVPGLVALFWLVSSATAATNYVSPSGSDGNDGQGWGTAWQTINYAVTNTVAGDTVLVSNGTYNLTVTVDLTNDLTVRSVNGAAVTTVNGGGAVRCFYLDHADALVHGFTITNGYKSQSGHGGGGVYCYTGGGRVENCIITGNIASDRGAGVTLYQGGVLRNCVIAGNTCAGYGAGCYAYLGGTLENCVIAHNTSAQDAGGIYFHSGGSAKNCIAYYNRGPIGNNYNTGTRFSYSCTFPDPGGTGNTGEDPQFVDADAHDYRLLPSSPCTNAGSYVAWMDDLLDLDGNSRIAGGVVDMGAYEYTPGALECSFAAADPDGPERHQVVFIGYAVGTNTAGATYLWDFTSDGAVDEQGAGRRIVTNTYARGVYSVTLSVTNDAGESNAFTRLAYVHVGPSNVYVSLSGGHSSPYTNWIMAATNIQDAVDVGEEGTVVWVTNGTYGLSDTITIAQGVTVRSVNGHATTVIDGNNAMRCLYVNHADALVDGFTITRGRKSAANHGGGGVYCYVDGGTIQNCMITNNWASDRGGGATLYYGGTMRNCVLAGNTATTYGGGLYVHRIGPLVENCTITGNTGTYGGGVYANAGGTFRNTIIYFNTAANGPNTYSSGSYTYCCTIDPVKSGTGNISGDPLLADVGQGDNHLTPASPCTNAGTYLSWMTGAFDLDGNDRIAGGAVDMGAYEYAPGALECDFVADAAEGIAPHIVELTATAVGDTVGLVYKWDYDGDGNYEVEGAGRQVVTNTFVVGTHTVSLTVTNAAGNTATETKPDYILAAPLTMYVSLTGSDASPYDSWATAASNIHSAVDMATHGTTIRIGAGRFVLSDEVTLGKGITVEGAYGVEDTLIDGSNTVRGFFLTHADAIVDGLTITNCRAAGGAGAYLFGAGLVQNCILVGNTSTSYGGGARCDAGGTVRNCLIRKNNCGGNSGAGVFITGTGGTVENCTIVYNTAGNGGGGIYNSTAAGRVRNTILAYNKASTSWPDPNYLGTGQLTYSCTPVMVHPGTSNIMANPLFVDLATDFRLQDASPCVGKGTPLAWMTPGATDLDGMPRVAAGGGVDMGAYERQPAPGTVFLIR